MSTTNREAAGAILLLVGVGLYLASCTSNAPFGRGIGNPPPPPPPITSVTTYHNDNARPGQNLSETTLTTANVNATGFGMLFVIAADGKVDAQPLYLPGLSVAGAAHTVLFVATEHGSVYGFDADTGRQLGQGSRWPREKLPAMTAAAIR